MARTQTDIGTVSLVSYELGLNQLNFYELDAVSRPTIYFSPLVAVTLTVIPLRAGKYIQRVIALVVHWPHSLLLSSPRPSSPSKSSLSILYCCALVRFQGPKSFLWGSLFSFHSGALCF